VLLENLIRLKLLLLYVFLGVVEGDICHALAALSDEFFEKKVVGRGLHVVAVSLNESFDLFDFEILTILK
jgi:phosphotransferase system IIA component